jgi:CheY-like chemotaxis protein
MAALLETSADEEIARRAEGLIGSLWAIAEGSNPSHPTRSEWLVRAAGLTVGDTPAEGVRDLPSAWRLVSELSGTAQPTLARRVTKQLGLAVADLNAPEPAAVRLVPEALMRGGHLVPVKEDAETITVVTADPTSLLLELDLLKVTGRKPVFAVAPPELIDAALSGLLKGRSVASARSGSDTSKEEPEGTVLVVDDDEDVRLFIRKALERQNFAVIEAGDGVEALEAIKTSPRPVSLALVDLEMPRMTGRELLRELRPAGSEAEIPVIIVTGHEELLLELDLMDDGADDYIRKPFDPRLLIARVRATLKRTEG